MKWQYRKLRELAVMFKGRTPPRGKAEFYSQSGMPWVKVENLKRRTVVDSEEYLSPEGVSQGKVAPKGAVLLSVNRTIGKVGIAGVDLQTNQQIAAIICDREVVLPEYLYYYFLYAREQLQKRAYVTLGSSINMEMLKDIIVPIPEMEKQQQWVELLMQVEEFLWNKEDMLETVQKCRELESPRDGTASVDWAACLERLEGLLRETVQTGYGFLDSVLYELFWQADADKEQIYYSGEGEYVTENPLEALSGPVRDLLEMMSDFQRELYIRFLKEKEPAATHDMLKRLKEISPRFSDYHIQDAVVTVDMFRQLGLMAEPEERKLYYNQGRTEENEVQDEDGNTLSIWLWKCKSTEEERNV